MGMGNKIIWAQGWGGSMQVPVRSFLVNGVGLDRPLIIIPLDEVATEPGAWQNPSVRDLFLPGTRLERPRRRFLRSPPGDDLNTRTPIDEITMNSGAQSITVFDRRWPIKIPRGMRGAHEAINASKSLRVHSDDDSIPYLAEICREDTTIVLRTAHGIEIGSLETDFGNPTAQALAAIVKRAETLGRAERLRTLGGEHEGFLLRHGVRVERGKVVGGEMRLEKGDELREVEEGDRVHVAVRNEGTEIVFVSGVEIDVAGDITSLDRQAGLSGHKLSPGQSFTFGGIEDGNGQDGLEVVWPPSVPREQPVEGRFGLIVTNSPVDLNWLVTADISPVYDGGLERLPRIESVCGNTTEARTASEWSRVPCSIIEIPFSLVPRVALAAEPQLIETATDESGCMLVAEESPDLVSRASLLVLLPFSGSRLIHVCRAQSAGFSAPSAMSPRSSGWSTSTPKKSWSW